MQVLFAQDAFDLCCEWGLAGVEMLAPGATPTLAGGLRNARAVAAQASMLGRHIAVIPAGECWPGGRLRPNWEDWVGAGAILAHLPGTRSPEVQAAISSFTDAADHLAARLLACGSGQELFARDRAQDIHLAAALNISDGVPVLREGAYRGAGV